MLTHIPLASILLLATSVSGQLGYNPSWAGALLSNPHDHGTFNTVIGTFVVPHIIGQIGSAIFMSVGFDTYLPCAASLEVGIEMRIQDDNSTSYYAWRQWYPESSQFFEDFFFRPGDELRVALHVYGPGSGLVTIDNLSNYDASYANVSSPDYGLCVKTVAWAIEVDNHGTTPLPYLDSVSFTGDYSTTRYHVDPAVDTSIFNIALNGENLTSVTTDSTSITIQRIH